MYMCMHLNYIQSMKRNCKKSEEAKKEMKMKNAQIVKNAIEFYDSKPKEKKQHKK